MRWLALLMSLLIFASAPVSTSAQTAWTPINDPADVYPTARDAVESMIDGFTANLRTSGFNPRTAHIVVGEIKGGATVTSSEVLSGGSESGSISAQSGPDVNAAARDGAVRVAIDRLVRNLHPAKSARGPTTAEPGENDVFITIGIDNSEHVERSGLVNIRGYQGRLKGKIVTAHFQDAFEADFQNKPWVTEWTSFMRSQPQRTWIAGRSGYEFTNPNDAEAAACMDAAIQLVRMSENRIDISNPALSQDVLRGMITAQLRSGVATERFLQRIDGRNGSTWRAAVLVSGNGESLKALLPTGATLQEPARTSSFSHSSGFSSGGSILIMALVIVLLYCFLNRATRGYFTWRLRFGGLALLLIVIALFLFGGLMFFRATVQHVASPVRAEMNKR